MQYIDKSVHREEGNRITLQYLEDIKIEDEQRYPVDYNNSFRNLPDKENSYYKQMTDILLVNQRYYCCYCMRRLTGNKDITLEHIIPQNVDKSRISYYQRDEVSELKDNIVLSEDFSHTPNPSLEKLPHTVAYDNLSISCKGELPKRKHSKDVIKDGQCCNNARGNEDLFPIYLLDNSNLIVYHKSGKVLEGSDEYWQEDVRKVISKAKLNCPTLQDIRLLWFILKDNAMEEICSLGKEKDTRLDLIRDALFLTSLPDEKIDNLLTKFEKEDYWNTFLLYDWFHSVIWDEA